jgi:hypothetical protein
MAVVLGPVSVLLAVLLMSARLRVWAASLRCARGCVVAVIVLEMIR